jgi:hypothetical protein
MKVIVQPIPVSATDSCNVSNLPPRPVDYADVYNSHRTESWCGDRAVRVHVPAVDTAALQRAADAYAAGASRVNLEDVSEGTVADVQAALDAVGPAFVRSQHVSLKAGVHGVGPYTDARRVLEGIATASRGHTPLACGGPLVLFVFPWLDLDPAYELRVFLYKGVMTAASQQHLYSPSPVWATVDPTPFLTAAVAAIPRHITTAVVDVGFTRDTLAPYFIEANPFGGHYTSGSGLFHWVIDDGILRSDGAAVHFRYTTSD